MIASWQLQEAKNKLSRLINQAVSDGPQLITRHGTEVAVVLSYEEYRSLTQEDGSLLSFLQESPFARQPIDLQRNKSESRTGFVV